MLKSKEHYDLIAAFERSRKERFDKEEKSLWPKGIIYQDGRVNALFLGYRDGYAYGKTCGQSADVYDVESDLQNAIASRDGYREERDALRTALELVRMSAGWQYMSDETRQVVIAALTQGEQNADQ